MIAADSQQKRPDIGSWLLFILLCVIWGSSFILMKIGLFDRNGNPLLSAYQVAGLRILGAGFALLPFIQNAIKSIYNQSKLRYVILSGLLGSFFPAFLFSLSELKISSAFAGFINSVTPLFTLLVAHFFYHQKFPAHKTWGVLVGLAGCVLLFVEVNAAENQQLLYGLFALLATLFYALNVNLVKHHLTGANSLHIASVAFVFLIPPCLLILWVSGYFQLPLMKPEFLKASMASIGLGISSTAIASVLFYKLVRKAGVIFSSMVTYGIPFVALTWAAIFGESISTLQCVALAIILLGVYLANQTKPKPDHL